MSQTDDKYCGDRILVSIFSQPWPQGQCPVEKPCEKYLQPYEDGKADADYLLLQNTFKDHENITVTKSLNRRTEFQTHEYISKIDAGEYDKFIFIFLTYKGAEDGLIHLHDTQQYQVEKAFDEMKKIQAMNGKPKLMLVQADDLTIKTVDWSAKGQPLPPRRKKKIPSDVDRLIMTSTIPQKDKGNSPMIQAFCEVIQTNWKRTDQNDMFTLATDINYKVKEYIAEREDKELLEVPLIFSSLTKDLMIEGTGCIRQTCATGTLSGIKEGTEVVYIY